MAKVKKIFLNPKKTIILQKKKMIQRIQTLYLLSTMGLLSLLFFFPLAILDLRGTDVLINISGFATDFEFSKLKFLFPTFLGLTSLIIFILTLSIFSFKNRKRQIKLITLSFLLNVILVGFLFLGIEMLAKRIEPALEEEFSKIIAYQWVIYAPVLSLLFMMLASKAIKKDEALIRSSDRLR